MPITLPESNLFGQDVSEKAKALVPADERSRYLGIPEDVTRRAMETAITSAEKLSRGELPEGTKLQISQASAEKAVRGGYWGQSAKNLELRDIGVASLDAITQGMANVTALASVQQKYDILREEMRQFDSDLAIRMRETDIKSQTLQMAAIEQVAKTQQFAQELVNNLIIENSRTSIAGVQKNIDDLLSYFKETERAFLTSAGIGVTT